MSNHVDINRIVSIDVEDDEGNIYTYSGPDQLHKFKKMCASSLSKPVDNTLPIVRKKQTQEYHIHESQLTRPLSQKSGTVELTRPLSQKSGAFLLSDQLITPDEFSVAPRQGITPKKIDKSPVFHEVISGGGKYVTAGVTYSKSTESPIELAKRMAKESGFGQ